MLFVQKIKKTLTCCHGLHDASKVSLRSVFILCGILHVETTFDYKGDQARGYCMHVFLVILKNANRRFIVPLRYLKSFLLLSNMMYQALQL